MKAKIEKTGSQKLIILDNFDGAFVDVLRCSQCKTDITEENWERWKKCKHCGSILTNVKDMRDRLDSESLLFNQIDD